MSNALVRIIPNLKDSAARPESGTFAHAVELLELSTFQVVGWNRPLLKVRKTRRCDRPVFKKISPSTFGFFIEHCARIGQVPRQKSREQLVGQIIMRPKQVRKNWARETLDSRNVTLAPTQTVSETGVGTGVPSISLIIRTAGKLPTCNLPYELGASPRYASLRGASCSG